MRTLHRIALLSFLTLGFAPDSLAQGTIGVQGRILTTEGVPVDSTLGMLFKLYTGGIVVWTETHPSVSVVDGLYSVELGSITPFDTLTWSYGLMLGITIGGDPELAPRTPMGTSPTSQSLINLRVHRIKGSLGDTVNLVGGHDNNRDSTGVQAATIAGGGTASFPNKVNANGGSIGGGWGNLVEGSSGVISGGVANRAMGPQSVVGGGTANESSGENASLGGGQENDAFGDYATIGGGLFNDATQLYATVGGGHTNYATAQSATVGGGEGNWATQAHATVAGGVENMATGAESTVGGGQNNDATANRATIGGGLNNVASQTYATVAGGTGNVAGGQYSAIGGGTGNTTTSQGSTIGGGNNNDATDFSATVSGGENNIAGGGYSTIPGGRQNRARKAGSFAAGSYARSNHEGSFVWNSNAAGTSADSFSSVRDYQFLIKASGGVGIGENQTFAPFHVTKNNIGVSADDVFNDVILAEDADATIGIYSNPGGTWGSGINLVEMTSCGTLPCAPLPDFDNMWSIVRATSGSGNGLSFRFGTSTNYGSNSGKFAVYPNGDASVVGTLSVAGDLSVTGALSKGSGSFKIDHPLDPENKYLYHSFVESPDMMNVYNGNVMLDENGEALVELPAYFEALNRDFRYQLTCIGGFAPVFVADKIADGSFRIAGGEPGMEVSWQVTGIRKDPYAEMHPIVPEVEKPEAERGTYLHPEAYGAASN